MEPSPSDNHPGEPTASAPAEMAAGDSVQAEGPAGSVARASLEVDLQKWSLVTLAALAILYTLYLARPLLFPLTLALLVNLILKPFVLRLQKHGIPAVISTSLVMICILAASTVAVIYLQEPAQRWIEQAPRALQSATEKLEGLKEVASKISEASEKVDDMANLSGKGNSWLQLEVKEKESVTDQIFYTSTGFLTGATIFVVQLFFLLAAGDRMLEKLVTAMPTWKDKRRIVQLVQEVQHKVSAYLSTITVINAVLGLVIGLGLWAIGMPNPVLWGVMAALFNFIPFVGLFAGAAIVFMVALLTQEFSLVESLAAPAIYLGANTIEANFVTPALLGRSISLNPVILILAIFVWGWIWGIGGIVVAVPLMVVIKVACENSERFQAVGDLLAE